MTGTPAPPDRITLWAVRAAERTVWLLCEAEDTQGRRGFGEATLNGRETEVAVHFRAAADAVLREGPGSARDALRAAGSLAEAAAHSALDQALADLEARRQGVSVAALLGLGEGGTVSLYANINRGTALRTPEGFALQARRAAADGFRAVKIAPLDLLPPAMLDASDPRGGGAGAPLAVSAAIGRMRAVREAIGPGTDLLVDCHWLLDEAGARSFRDAAVELGIRYIESPLPETPGNLAAIAGLRRHYNEAGIVLAGGELLFDRAELAEIVRGQAMDVVMPDVKYVPSLRQYLSFVGDIAAGGLTPSPHNPSGPVAHAFSWQIGSAVPEIGWLEIQYAESPLFCELAGRADDVSEAAWNEAMPRGPGIGLDLRESALHRHQVGRMTTRGRGAWEGDGIFSAVRSGAEGAGAAAPAP